MTVFIWRRTWWWFVGSSAALSVSVICFTACGGGSDKEPLWNEPASKGTILQPAGVSYPEINGRRYRLSVPVQWNQVTPIPAVLWFAGSSRFRGYYGWSLDHNSWPQTCQAVGCVSLSFETARGDDYWDIMEEEDTGDDGFVEAALRDVQARYPVSGVYANGISFGGKYALWYILHHSEVQAAASYEGVIVQPDQPDLDWREGELRSELAGNARKFPILYVIGGKPNRRVYEDSLESARILASEGYPVQQIFTQFADHRIDTDQGHDWHCASEGRIFSFFVNGVSDPVPAVK